jgi:hypothetical protein
VVLHQPHSGQSSIIGEIEAMEQCIFTSTEGSKHVPPQLFTVLELFQDLLNLKAHGDVNMSLPYGFVTPLEACFGP